ncbi:MAG: undecaprenyl/decaprenyl-phosphate alpha-N-acetylglucosaminyl 1-phosphate transferase [Candidatus Symbiothrix sp.]|jgi:UDP-N-acetylmuramyl pentapeptide phosphotransferase/UDP-N-acetylglucosamine-1-phosphate transferase|nr:undecaprenyl/decaprenyl-phosphate alpha-N-acetylglucosaminyl 1-phosphate transferase [Candidatus Symbiothrix sp.]
MSLNVIIALFLGLGISIFSTYNIINFSKKLGWGDDPSEARKIHKKKVPNLGGVGLFIATMVSYFAFSDYANIIRPDKVFSITIFLFFIGLKDDMDDISVRSRFLMEFACAFFIILITDIRITTLWGIFGIAELPIVASYIITSIFIVGCINAYNLIDGLDGLLGSLALLGSICFGFIFNGSGEWLWTLLCVAMCGALLGFLFYNWYPAKIFMGNGGAIFIGTIFACFAVRVMQLDPFITKNIHITMTHTMAFSIISIPVVDMFTVFMIRIYCGFSPFRADNLHVHHRITKGMGFNHAQASLFLVFVNILIILFAYHIQYTGALRSLLYTILFCCAIELAIIFVVHKGKKRK